MATNDLLETVQRDALTCLNCQSSIFFQHEISIFKKHGNAAKGRKEVPLSHTTVVAKECVKCGQLFMNRSSGLANPRTGDLAGFIRDQIAASNAPYKQKEPVVQLEATLSSEDEFPALNEKVIALENLIVELTTQVDGLKSQLTELAVKPKKTKVVKKDKEPTKEG